MSAQRQAVTVRLQDADLEQLAAYGGSRTAQVEAALADARMGRELAEIARRLEALEETSERTRADLHSLDQRHEAMVRATTQLAEQSRTLAESAHRIERSLGTQPRREE